MIHLRSVQKREMRETDNFPFNVPIIQALQEISFQAPVTFFVGENGSGKSTLMEAIACAIGSVTVGSESVKTDPTLAHMRKLADYLRLTWSKRTHKGFFLRAEDFFGYAKQIAKTRQELEQELNNVDREYAGRSKYAKDLAKMPHRNEIGALQRRYGDGLDVRSHGESFLDLFQSRFVPGGLYLLDEPEAPLSPLRQLSFLSMLKQMTTEDAQFIIATHSPIILAFPEAQIMSFNDGAINNIPYDELEHVTLTRAFLNDPQSYMRHL
ncbi:MAG: AAA family ATPase [Anaerolineales bacterium]|jgi:predicted ATPase|nr:AAA family ATPase [Anaerolineales bacterium]